MKKQHINDERQNHVHEMLKHGRDMEKSKPWDKSGRTVGIQVFF